MDKDEEHVVETVALHRAFQRARVELQTEIACSRTLIRRVAKTLSHADAMLAKIRRGEMPPSINRILIIDGDVAAGHVLELALGELGHLAESASTSSSAIVLARYFVPDIILVDIGLDNWDLPRALRAQRHVRTIMVTGCGEDDSRQRSFDAGFDEHLLKSDHLARIVNGLAA